MDRVDRLFKSVEPFAVLFLDLGIVLTLPAGPASLHRRTQSMALNSHGRLIFIKNALPPTPLARERIVGPEPNIRAW